MKKNIFLGIAVTSLAGFSGCRFWEAPKEEKTDLGAVVVSVGGKPVIREKELDPLIKQVLQAYPQLQMVDAASLPASFKKALLAQLAQQELIIAWAEKNSIESRSEFRKAYDDAVKLVRKHILMQHFEKHLMDSVQVTDAQVKGEYDQNKKKYVKTEGGVLLSAVEFASEESAKGFLEKAKNAEEFNKLGRKEHASKFKDFYRVSKDTENASLPDALKKAVLGESKFPAFKVVKSGNKYWAASISDKKATEYFGFDEIKGRIEGMMRTQKAQELLSSRLEDLKKEFPVEINEKLLGEDSAQVQAVNTEGNAKSKVVLAKN